MQRGWAIDLVYERVVGLSLVGERGAVVIVAMVGMMLGVAGGARAKEQAIWAT